MPKVLESVDAIIKHALGNGVFSHNEELQLNHYLKAFDISSNDLNTYRRELLIKGLLIRNLIEDIIKPCINALDMPFNLMKSEILVWGFSPISITEMKQQKEWFSGSKGVSICLAKGIYWHLGKTKGKYIEKQVMKVLGSGIVIITSHNLYIYYNNKPQRIKLDKIISILKR